MTMAFAEVVDGCQLKCALCWNRHREPSFQQMRLEVLEKFITKYYPWRKGIFGWGEPLLHKDFLTIAKMIEGTNTDLSSNLSLNLSDEYFDAIQSFARVGVSISGMTREVYNLYHQGGHFDLVMENIKRLADRKRTRTSVYFLLHKDNVHQYESAVRYFTGMGLEVQPVRLFCEVEDLMEGFTHPYLKDREYYYQRRRFNCKEVRNPRFDVDGNHLLCCGTRNIKIGPTLDDDIPEEMLIEIKMNHPLCKKCQEGQHWRIIRGNIK